MSSLTSIKPWSKGQKQAVVKTSPTLDRIVHLKMQSWILMWVDMDHYGCVRLLTSNHLRMLKAKSWSTTQYKLQCLVYPHSMWMSSIKVLAPSHQLHQKIPSVRGSKNTIWLKVFQKFPEKTIPSTMQTSLTESNPSIQKSKHPLWSRSEFGPRLWPPPGEMYTGPFWGCFLSWLEDDNNWKK